MTVSSARRPATITLETTDSFTTKANRWTTVSGVTGGGSTTHTIAARQQRHPRRAHDPQSPHAASTSSLRTTVATAARVWVKTAST